ncbi:sister chromatid cohesion protein DCC1-like, partial [Actinia tenebrosa]|uniref:Sister chromatid cohesion protein DCC1 n=1 Tax=Actinia tenebrosa TaxID=6105 RepID=A0A6P8HKC0_ACTTE
MAGNIEQPRTIEDVQLSANAAGLVSVGPVQTLKFSENCMSNEYKLIELPPKLLEKLQQGESFVIRGENQEDAMLCTKDSTYEIKLADTSNALLLTPECQTNKDPDLIEHQVCSCHSEYFEVRLVRPQLYKLRNLLRETLYRGPEYETKENGELRTKVRYSFDDLLNLVQASEKEIWDALEKLGAIAIN